MCLFLRKLFSTRPLKILIHRNPLIKLIYMMLGSGIVVYVGDAENCMFICCCCILFSFRYNLMNYIINSYLVFHTSKFRLKLIRISPTFVIFLSVCYNLHKIEQNNMATLEIKML